MTVWLHTSIHFGRFLCHLPENVTMEDLFDETESPIVTVIPTNPDPLPGSPAGTERWAPLTLRKRDIEGVELVEVGEEEEQA